MTDEERAKRIHHHMYETCEGIAEHAERIVKLEELCIDLWSTCESDCLECDYVYDGGACMLYKRMCELGIEV